MKKFVELIQRVHKERFSVVMNKIITEKIPVAFLSLAPLEESVKFANQLREKGTVLSNIITLTPPRRIFSQILI